MFASQPGIIDHLSRLSKVRTGISGQALTTYAIGGPLAALVEPETEVELGAVLQFLTSESIPFRILGAGSNVLISDDGVQQIVIRLGKGFRGVREIGTTGSLMVLEIGAASALMTLSRTVSEQGLSGLEFAGGIPASMGGAVFMNAGAHGGEISSVLTEVLLFRGVEKEWVAVSKFPFTYRHSGIEADAVVAAVRIALAPGDRNIISARRAEHLKERKLRQPLTVPSAGSVFKNPSPARTAGKVVEECGLKGRAIGGAVVSPMHGNWIVNPERKATAADVRALMRLCIETAQSAAGVTLQPEVKQW